jgi:hypothetical protein
MSWFPQIGSGSIAQFPATRSRKWRDIVNQLESGERILLPDIPAGQVEWKLSYQELTDTECQNLSGLFNACQGGFASFTFIDPLANLFGFSESLSQPSWQTGLLQIAAGVSDPLATTRASALTNPGAGAQTLQQTVGVSGDYTVCFSAYLRSDTPASITLQRDGTPITVNVGPVWTRAFLSGTGTSGAVQSTFSVGIAAGQTIDIWGLQVEAQPYPSAYKQTVPALGIYEETYFADEALTITSTNVGFSSCELTLMSRVS